MTYLDTRDLIEMRDNAIENHLPIDTDEITRVLDEIGDEARYGVTMIPVHLFEDYARELASDIGATHDDAQWPYTCIDWAEAARQLALDYTEVTFEGRDYMVRL